MTTSGPTLLVENIHKSFGSHQVLNGISLEAQAHDVIAILGASGSGKSTLLRCINMLEMPDHGHITLRDERVAIRKDRAGRSRPSDVRQVQRMRRRLGMVFQQFNLWSHKTALENVALGPQAVLGADRKASVARAEALLTRVGLARHCGHYPCQLSGGQQQRVAIARALAMEPYAILFDEPTSALDPELVGEVLQVMRDLAAAGTTMIVVTHELGFAREVSNRTMFLHQGQIHEEGPSAEMFARPKSDRFRQFLVRTRER